MTHFASCMQCHATYDLPAFVKGRCPQCRRRDCQPCLPTWVPWTIALVLLALLVACDPKTSPPVNMAHAGYGEYLEFVEREK